VFNGQKGSVDFFTILVVVATIVLAIGVVFNAIRLHSSKLSPLAESAPDSAAVSVENESSSELSPASDVEDINEEPASSL